MANNWNEAQLATYLTAVDYMTRVLYYTDSVNAPDIYEILSQLFLYLVLGHLSQPLVVYKGTTYFLDQSLQEKNDLILPFAVQGEHEGHPQIVYSDSRFLQYNQYHLHNHRVLEDYVKLLHILPADEPVPALGSQNEHWGPSYWHFIHLLTVAADRYLNAYWAQQRGHSLQAIQDSEAHRFYKRIADGLYLYFSTYLPDSIPCEHCKNHYLALIEGSALLSDCIYQIRSQPNWILADYFYHIHNTVNLTSGQPSYPMEEFTAKKNALVTFIEQMTEKSNALIKATSVTVDLNLADTQNGTRLRWFGSVSKNP